MEVRSGSSTACGEKLPARRQNASFCHTTPGGLSRKKYKSFGGQPLYGYGPVYAKFWVKGCPDGNAK